MIGLYREVLTKLAPLKDVTGAKAADALKEATKTTAEVFIVFD